MAMLLSILLVLFGGPWQIKAQTDLTCGTPEAFTLGEVYAIDTDTPCSVYTIQSVPAASQVFISCTTFEPMCMNANFLMLSAGTASENYCNTNLPVMEGETFTVPGAVGDPAVDLVIEYLAVLGNPGSIDCTFVVPEEVTCDTTTPTSTTLDPDMTYSIPANTECAYDFVVGANVAVAIDCPTFELSCDFPGLNFLVLTGIPPAIGGDPQPFCNDDNPFPSPLILPEDATGYTLRLEHLAVILGTVEGLECTISTVTPPTTSSSTSSTSSTSSSSTSSTSTSSTSSSSASTDSTTSTSTTSTSTSTSTTSSTTSTASTTTLTAGCDSQVTLGSGETISVSSSSADLNCDSEIVVPSGVGVDIQCTTFDVLCFEDGSVSILRDRPAGDGRFFPIGSPQTFCGGYVSQLEFPAGGVQYDPESSQYILNIINRSTTGVFMCTVTGT